MSGAKEQPLHDVKSARERARSQFDATDYSGAVETLRRAIAVYPNVAALHGDLGQALQADGRHAAAVEAYDRAISLDPNFVAALCGVAQVHERLHRLDAAREAVTRARRAEPSNPYPRLYLASLDRRQGNVEQAQRELEQLVSESPPAEVLFRVWYELGALLDEQKDFDNAMLCFRAAKAVPATSEPPALEWAEGYFSAIEDGTASIRDEHLKRWVEDRDGATDRCAHLVGFPRSGTTLTEQVLAAHPRVVATDERNLLNEALGLLSDDRSAALLNAEKLDSLSRKRRSEIVQEYLSRADAVLGEPVGDRVLVEKQPLNLLLLPQSVRILPGTKVIFALRDPRDVVLSCFVQNWEFNPVSVQFATLERAAEFYVRVMSAWVEFRERCPLQWIEMKYEDTVGDLAAQARRMTDLLGVAFEESVTRFHERARGQYVRTPSYHAVAKPVHTAAVARWRRYEKHFGAALETLAPMLRAFGYEQ